MLTDYQRRVGLVVEAARLMRNKRQSDVAKEATALGFKLVQSTVSAVEVGHAQTTENLKALCHVLGVDIWVVFRVADALEGNSDSPAGKVKALAKAIEQLEAHLRDAQQ